MRLIIAEKPELGRAIADAIFTNPKEESNTISEGDTTVIWCFGHMLQLVDPKEIDEKYDNKLNESLLPIYFDDWSKTITEDKKERTAQIGKLISQASLVINAGDPDDEGQCLIDELLDYYKYKGETQRVLINDNLPDAIRREFQNLKDNEKFRCDGEAAYARQMADYTFGINWSRLGSIRMHHWLSTGRVQAPSLGLVVRRDEAIANHVKSKYFDILAKMQVKDFNAIFKFNTKDKQAHIEDKAKADAICESIKEEYHLEFTEKEKSSAAPLPYNQTKLQSDMNERYGYSLKETLSITQALREKYKAITYNRSDCQYLSEQHFSEAPNVLKTALFNINKNLPLDFNIKSKCFNDKNVSAHHGIIPQNKMVKIETMTPKEKNVYIAIVERYAMQFLPSERSVQSTCSIPIPEGELRYSSSKVIDKGYKKYFGEEVEKKTNNDYIEQGTYAAKTIAKQVVERETKPLKKYTPGSLVEDMSSIAKYVSDQRIKDILKKKDEGKKGENGSIGTVATRSAVIDTLIKKNYLAMDGKFIISTELGRQYFHSLPKEISSPDVTAKWWLIQEDIRQGQKNRNDLMHSIVSEFNSLKASAFDGVKISTNNSIGKCPICNHDILVGKSKKTGKLTYYCSDYENGCTFRMYENMRYFKDEIHITRKKAEDLIAGKHIKEKLTSKEGKEYEAFLKIEINGQYVYFKRDGFPRKRKK